MSAALPWGHLPPRWAGVELTDLDPRGVQRGNTRGASVDVDEGRFANHLDVSGLSPHQRLGALVEYAVWLAGRRDELAAISAELPGRDLACACPINDPACHRNVLLDIANPPAAPGIDSGHVMGLTLRRPWASLLLIPAEIGGKNIENRLWTTDYRGPVLIRGGSGEIVDKAGVEAATRAGFDSDWHVAQKGWLGAAVLTDVHRAHGRCCGRWGQQQRRPDRPIYHWVFDHPARLAARGWGKGFPGLRSVSWSELFNRSALKGELRPQMWAHQ